MGKDIKVKVLKLTEEQRKQLEDGCSEGSIMYRARCLAMLMKSEGIHTGEIEKRTGISACTINSLRRAFERDGIAALPQTTRKRGRVHNEKKPFVETFIFRQRIKSLKNRIGNLKDMWMQSCREDYSDEAFVEYMCAIIRDVCAEDSKDVETIKNKE